MIITSTLGFTYMDNTYIFILKIIVTKTQPILKAIKRGVEFSWTEECEESFLEFKHYLSQMPLLSKPKDGGKL